MHKNVIFCYSGTGNCLNFAKNVAENIGGADIIMMRKRPEITDVTEAERVGFVFPCFGGGAPEDVLKYAKEIKVSPSAYTFGISMSASYAGIGLSTLNEIIPLNYWATVTHQCSCIWLFPHDLMMPKLNVADAQARSEKLAWEIAASIKLKRNKDKKPPRNPVNALENKAWTGIAGKKAAQFKVNNDCIACGQCVRLCPRENIEIVDGKAKIGTNCIQCLGCLQFCPKSAISIGEITDKREHYHNPKVTVDDLTQSIIHVEAAFSSGT